MNNSSLVLHRGKFQMREGAGACVSRGLYDMRVRKRDCCYSTCMPKSGEYLHERLFRQRRVSRKNCRG